MNALVDKYLLSFPATTSTDEATNCVSDQASKLILHNFFAVLNQAVKLYINSAKSVEIEVERLPTYSHHKII